MKSKHLDEQIRKALKDLEAKYDPKSWDAFEERLDVASDPLDNLVAERLTGFEVPLQASDWGRMEQLIEAEETAELIESEAHIENLAYEKLHRLEVPFQHSHWHLMAKRLEEEFSLRHKLYRYKVAELALMALLLLTVIRFAPHAESLLQRHQQGWHQEPMQILPEASQQGAGQKNISPQSVPEKTGPASSLRAPVALSPTAQQPSSRVNPISNNAKERMPTAQASVSQNNLTPINKAVPGIHGLPALKTAGVRSQSVPVLFEEMQAGRSWLNNRPLTPPVRGSEGSADFLPPLPAGPVQSQFPWEVPLLPQAIFEKESSLRFSLFAASDISYVFTPSNNLSVFDTLVPTMPDTTLASGYGGGILISWKKDRWEFQTGGVYSFRRYMPNTPVFLFETMNYYIREEFHGVQMDLLQVPLNLQYHFKNTGKWRFYGNGGIAGHFITSSVYEITHERVPSFKLAAMPPPEGDVLEDNTSLRNEKDFPKGLLDGGDLRSNLYLTANLGLGVERYVSSRWSLFFQPNYQHFLMSEGVGTNKDKFYTLSFNLGTKVSLK